MTRFVTYDPEVAARLVQAVGVHRVELRPSAPHMELNPALMDALHESRNAAVLMPSSDEQVLIIRVNDDPADETLRPKRRKKRKKNGEETTEQVGSRPSGFLGLEDEVVFPDEEEDPPRSLWKKDE